MTVIDDVARHRWLTLALTFLSLLSMPSSTRQTSRPFRSTATEKMRMGLEKTVFVILSQSNSFHSRRARDLAEDLKSQAKRLLPTASTAGLSGGDGRDLLDVELAHETYPDRLGTRIVMPILPDLLDKWGQKKVWVVFCQDNTVIDLRHLLAILHDLNPLMDSFFGRPLVDISPTVIHHYSLYDETMKFTYPDFASGFVLSFALIKRSVPRWIKEDKDRLDFTIDPKHELAKFFWQGGDGVRFKELPQFCGGRNLSSSSCATFYDATVPSCGEAVSLDDLVIGVKTFHGHHDTRVPVVKATWASDASRLWFFSDAADDALPSVDLGVENVPRGHCAKTLAIIRYAIESLVPFKWLLIADDDTLLSVPRLRRLLACYNPAEDVALGEGYGYGLSTGYGYDYLTGGGGFLLSEPLARKLLRCPCRQIDTPDDMHIGMCLSSLKVDIVHSSLFHQARPQDYAVGYLADTEPISFHKFEMHDPIQSYGAYLTDRATNLNQRDEL